MLCYGKLYYITFRYLQKKFKTSIKSRISFEKCMESLNLIKKLG